MSYTDLLYALRYRWRLVAAALAVSVVAAAIWTMASPRQYQATATLLFDFSESADSRAQPAATPPAAMLATQASIIQSEQVASQVAVAAGLPQNADLRERWRASGARQPFQDWLGALLLGGLQVSPAKNSNVLSVGYRAADPEAAASFANGFADAFVHTQLRLRTEPAKVYSDWFARQIADARGKLERSQAQLTAFQQQHGLIGGEKLDVELNHLSDLTGQLAIAEAAAADASARARSGGAASPEVQMSGTVAALRSVTAMKAAEVQQLGATLGPNHPQLQTAQAALGELRAKLGEAIGHATRSLGASSASGASRVADLRGRIAGQRQHVLRLSAMQDELQVLQRDVNSAKADYDGVRQSFSAARLRAQIPQTNVKLLDRASIPLLPVSPDVGLRLTLAVLFGLLLGLGLVVAAEWRDPLVRTPEGLMQQTGVPTLLMAAQRPRSITAEQGALA